MVLYLGEPPGGFCDVGCCFCFYVSGLPFHATGTPPWRLELVKVSTSSELYPGYFRLLYFSVTILPRALQFLVGIFYPQAFFTLRFFPTFGKICFYQGFPGSRQFFLEGCRTSHWGSQHRPGPCVCLNHTVFSKRYKSVGSI